MRPVQEERRARFEAVAALVGEPLRRYAVRRTDAETAQDVVADAFLVIWRRLDDVPPGGELPWCYAVVRNCLANAERSARRQQGLVARIASMAAPPPVTDQSALPDPDLHRALARMRADDRELLMLWAWEDLRPAEIATVLGVTPNAVNIRLHRARRRLADLVEPARSGKPGAAAGQEQVKERRRP